MKSLPLEWHFTLPSVSMRRTPFSSFCRYNNGQWYIQENRYTCKKILLIYPNHFPGRDNTECRGFSWQLILGVIQAKIFAEMRRWAKRAFLNTLYVKVKNYVNLTIWQSFCTKKATQFFSVYIHCPFLTIFA